MDVMLRPWRPEDAPSIARHADDPQVAANLRDVFPCPYQLSDAEEFIRLCRAAEPEQGRGTHPAGWRPPGGHRHAGR